VAFSIAAAWVTSRGKEAEDALKRAHDQLEARVEERTAALSETNRQLRDEMAERRRAEEAYQQAQGELAHVTRVLSMGEMTASIAHEVNQPLSGVMINANAGLRWLAADTPNIDEARQAINRIIRDGRRAGDVIARIRALSKKTGTSREKMDINEAIEEIVGLAQGEARRNATVISLQLMKGLPPVTGDRVQLQQVVLNLVMNGIEAMSTVTGHLRELTVKTENDKDGRIRVSVRDAGIGFEPETKERLFDAFYTTKRTGLGIGLSISRSIVASHGGRLWAVQNDGPGATFLFTIPTDSASQVAT
jgi:C4-dicarboxylate-specific signal transduction histidine kinase